MINTTIPQRMDEKTFRQWVNTLSKQEDRILFNIDPWTTPLEQLELFAVEMIRHYGTLYLDHIVVRTS